jgi:sodium-dependent dicarboxylate transporter 2/3/5
MTATREDVHPDYRDDAELLLDDHDPPTPEQPGKLIVIKVLFALAVGLGIYLLPTPANLPDAGHKLLALVAAVIVLWVS